MSGEEQSDPVGRSLVKRHQESEPALISVSFSFLLRLPLVEKWERGENCPSRSIMFDEERLDPHGVCNLPHVLTKTKLGRIWSQDARITDVLTKFQSISGYISN